MQVKALHRHGGPRNASASHCEHTWPWNTEPGRCGPGSQLPAPHGQRPSRGLWPHARGCEASADWKPRRAHGGRRTRAPCALCDTKTVRPKEASEKPPCAGHAGQVSWAFGQSCSGRLGFVYFPLVVTQPCFVSHAAEWVLEGTFGVGRRSEDRGSAATVETGLGPAAAWLGLSTAGLCLPPGSTVMSAQLPHTGSSGARTNGLVTARLLPGTVSPVAPVWRQLPWGTPGLPVPTGPAFPFSPRSRQPGGAVLGTPEVKGWDLPEAVEGAGARRRRRESTFVSGSPARPPKHARLPGRAARGGRCHS